MSFKDIKGQDNQIAYLKRAIDKKSVAHAYLFSGIDGVGKSLAATNFAKTLNCERNESDSCDVCASCRKIENKNHPDIFRITPDETQKVIKIASIRAMSERLSLRAYEARWKVFIIEDAHLMTEEAANSLLKTLEEPAAQSVIMLTTSNTSGLLETVVSRCQILKFSPLSSEIIENILIKKFGLQKDAASFMSRFLNGGIDKGAIVEGDDFIEWKNTLIDEFMNRSFLKEDRIYS